MVPGLSTQVRAGCLTLDVGSRRLVGRNRFRNTINAFTGIDAAAELDDGQTLGAFYLLPIERRPTGDEELQENEIEFDDEDPAFRFWGLYLTQEELFTGVTGAVYLFGLHDARSTATHRELVTPGLRLHTTPAPERWDFGLEMVVQSSESRLTSPPANLDHWAGFVHAHLARMFDASWSPRLVLQYDYASGDEDPSDGDNGRFDPLFGVLRLEAGGAYLIDGEFLQNARNTPGGNTVYAYSQLVLHFQHVWDWPNS